MHAQGCSSTQSEAALYAPTAQLGILIWLVFSATTFMKNFPAPCMPCVFIILTAEHTARVWHSSETVVYILWYFIAFSTTNPTLYMIDFIWSMVWVLRLAGEVNYTTLSIFLPYSQTDVVGRPFQAGLPISILLWKASVQTICMPKVKSSHVLTKHYAMFSTLYPQASSFILTV